MTDLEHEYAVSESLFRKLKEFLPEKVGTIPDPLGIIIRSWKEVPKNQIWVLARDERWFPVVRKILLLENQ